MPRQRVASALWPESTDGQALTNLRRELHHLRETFPAADAQIVVGTRTLAWCGDLTASDVRAFEDAVTRGLAGDAGALREAADLYAGDLLPGLGGEWLDAARDRLREQAAQTLRRLVAHFEADGALADATVYARQLLRLDPFDEEAWCALMRSHARRGERATALHVFQQCAALLRRDLGVQPSAATRRTYREIVALDDDVPDEPVSEHRGGAYPLIGRAAEWRALLGAWRTAAAGRPHLCLIKGEAGIGKSRLAEELVAWARLHDVRATTTRCYADEGRLAFAPIAAWLKDEAIRRPVHGLDAACLADVARLSAEVRIDRPDVPVPEGELESWQRLRFFESVSRAFRSAAPLILVLDDVQWADTDTLEWLHFFLRSAGDLPCLVVATLRADEERDNATLARLLGQLMRDRRVTSLPLAPLDADATAQLAAAVAGAPLDEAARARTFRDTEGHPLFIVELGHMATADERGDTAGAMIEGSAVQAVLAMRLARLSDEARAVAEVAAAVGRDFTFDVLASAGDVEEDALVRALDELWSRHIVRVHDEQRWDFSHDRIRDVAYAGIGPARRRLLHRRIAQAMELLWADRLDEVSAAIARHLERAGQPARALRFFERAAVVATRVSAAEEAIRCLNQAVSLVERLPVGRERDEQELALREQLSVALNAARGYAAPDVEQNLQRILALAGGRRGDLVPVRWLWGAFTVRFMLGDLAGARDVSEQALARSAIDPSCRCEAHHAMAGTLTSMGELETACEHFEAALAASGETPGRRSALGSDLEVFGHAWHAHALWLLGDEEAALAHSERALELARVRDHPYSQTLAAAYGAMLHQMRGDVDRLVALSTQAIELSARYGFGYYDDWARVLTGWVRGHEQPQEGIATIEAALNRLDTARALARRPYYLSLLAETCQRAGEPGRAAAIVEAAIAMATSTREHWWLPALLLQQSALAVGETAVAAWQRALDLARAQHSRGLEGHILAARPARPGT